MHEKITQQTDLGTLSPVEAVTYKTDNNPGNQVWNSLGITPIFRQRDGLHRLWGFFLYVFSFLLLEMYFVFKLMSLGCCTDSPIILRQFLMKLISSSIKKTCVWILGFPMDVLFSVTVCFYYNSSAVVLQLFFLMILITALKPILTYIGKFSCDKNSVMDFLPTICAFWWHWDYCGQLER